MNLAKIFGMFEELSSKENAGSSPTSKYIDSRRKDETLITPIFNQNKVNTDALQKEFTDFKLKTEEDIKSLNNKIKNKLKSGIADSRTSEQINKEIHHQNNDGQTNVVQFIEHNENKSKEHSNNNNNSGALNTVINVVNQLQENNKAILQNMSFKIGKEELEKLHKVIGLDLERIVNLF